MIGTLWDWLTWAFLGLVVAWFVLAPIYFFVTGARKDGWTW